MILSCDSTWGTCAVDMAICLGLSMVMAGQPTTANEWTDTAYQSRVFVFQDGVPEIQDAWAHRDAGRLQQIVSSRWASMMHVDISTYCTSQWLATAWDESAIDFVDHLDPQALGLDKVFVALVHADGGVIAVECAELDCRTRMWSSTVGLAEVAPSRLPSAIATGIFQCFRPIGRIVKVEAQRVTLELRAGALGGGSAAVLDFGAVLLPIVRRVDRVGEVAADGGIQIVPWTMLRVDEHSVRQGGWSGVITCALDSGFRSPLRIRSSARVERFALSIRPSHDSTVVQFRSASDADQPLVGYELYARAPVASNWTLVGTTDFRGELEVPREEPEYQFFLAKYGNAALARFPYLVGLDPYITIVLPDQQERLKAESFVRGIENELVDRITKREILVASIRKRLNTETLTQEHLDQASGLMDELRKSDPSAELLRKLQRREAVFQSNDRGVQRRIRLLFSQTRQAIRGAFNNETLAELEFEFKNAQRRLQPTGGTPVNQDNL